ncbi:glutamate--tRNA ligase [Patescibacteria group bacterium]|nr:glutamate--tRNA ligase [Patescibacteria group bacterium]
MEKSERKIRVRFAPSPTGLFHIGSARSALYNYLFARKNKGKFILRIEDTDLDRSKKEYEEDIIEGIKWLGLDWDEGPFRQSARTEIYRKYIKKLLDSDQAFYCDHSQEELEKEKKEQMKKKEAPKHICDRRGKAKTGIIRFRAPAGKIVFNDLIRGKVKFEGGLLGDFSLAKDEQTPLYNFGVVVDDAEMKISHVIRGEDHISNTPKQILLYQALDLTIPEFAHLPLILGPDRSKMSKRHGSISIQQYRQEGYLSEAMINFMVLLGWNSGTEKEIFSLDELIKEFSLERIHKGGAVFNLERLNWLNGQYIRRMNLDELTGKCRLYLPQDIDFDYAKKVVALEQKRMKKLSEIGETTKFFFEDDLDYEPELLVWKKMTQKEVKANLELLEKKLSEIENFNQKTLENEIMPLAEKHGKGELLWPLRVALTGQKASPGPFEVMEVLGKEKTLQRLKKASNVLI